MDALSFVGKKKSRWEKVKDQAKRLSRFLQENYTPREYSLILKLIIRDRIHDTTSLLETEEQNVAKLKEELELLKNIEL